MNSEVKDQVLRDTLLKQIRETGPIPFSTFMETALYDPDSGYYSRADTAGDYYTSADVHSVFARILANYFYREWKKKFTTGKNFDIVELGCGQGKLAGEILLWLSQNAGDLFQIHLRFR